MTSQGGHPQEPRLLHGGIPLVTAQFSRARYPNSSWLEAFSTVPTAPEREVPQPISPLWLKQAADDDEPGLYPDWPVNRASPVAAPSESPSQTADSMAMDRSEAVSAPFGTPRKRDAARAELPVRTFAAGGAPPWSADVSDRPPSASAPIGSQPPSRGDARASDARPSSMMGEPKLGVGRKDLGPVALRAARAQAPTETANIRSPTGSGGVRSAKATENVMSAQTRAAEAAPQPRPQVEPGMEPPSNVIAGVRFDVRSHGEPAVVARMELPARPESHSIRSASTALPETQPYPRPSVESMAGPPGRIAASFLHADAFAPFNRRARPDTPRKKPGRRVHIENVNITVTRPPPVAPAVSTPPGEGPREQPAPTVQRLFNPWLNHPGFFE
jgi:hypothetical protein